MAYDEKMKTLTVEEEISTVVRKVRYDLENLYIEVSGKEYSFPLSRRKYYLGKFVERYNNIKKNKRLREQNSLGKYFNHLCEHVRGK